VTVEVGPLVLGDEVRAAVVMVGRASFVVPVWRVVVAVDFPSRRIGLWDLCPSATALTVPAINIAATTAVTGAHHLPGRARSDATGVSSSARPIAGVSVAFSDAPQTVQKAADSRTVCPLGHCIVGLVSMGASRLKETGSAASGVGYGRVMPSARCPQIEVIGDSLTQR